MSEGSHRSAPAGVGPAGVVVAVPHAAVLLPAGVRPRIVEDVWRAVQDPAVPAESIVAVLPLRGPDEVASFAVVVHEPGDAGGGVRLQVVLRGDAVLDVAVAGDPQPRRLDARDALPFYLATVERVTAYRAARAAAEASTAAPDGLPLRAGAAAGDAVAWEPGTGSATTAAPALVATVLDPPPAERPVAPASAPAAPSGRRRGAHAHPDAVTDAEPPRRAAAADGAAGPDAAARARSAGVPTVAIATAPEADGPRVVHAIRILREDVTSGASPVDTGTERIPLDVPVLVGRRPRPPRIVRGAPPRLVAVPSPLGEISGTHLSVRQEAGAIVVTDLDSTNGTVVLAPGAERLALRPGESLVVVPGTRVDVGDGVVLEILSAR
ncbi:FHA domain-containing protein [Clavibacter zhangzhiyongii]|uniref:FHA domain-containing protein n=1 Tax=Clavibacter zhangzhiyongii TaxID=2768071 RepID=UPI0039E08E86